MDRVREREQSRKIVMGTILALIVAGVLLVLTYLWLFRRLLG